MRGRGAHRLGLVAFLSFLAVDGAPAAGQNAVVVRAQGMGEWAVDGEENGFAVREFIPKWFATARNVNAVPRWQTTPELIPVALGTWELGVGVGPASVKTSDTGDILWPIDPNGGMFSDSVPFELQRTAGGQFILTLNGRTVQMTDPGDWSGLMIQLRANDDGGSVGFTNVEFASGLGNDMLPSLFTSSAEWLFLDGAGPAQLNTFAWTITGEISVERVEGSNVPPDNAGLFISGVEVPRGDLEVTVRNWQTGDPLTDETGAPLPANVTVMPDGLADTTDANGVATFTGVIVGRKTVVAEAPGFDKGQVGTVISRNSDTKELITLMPRIEGIVSVRGNFLVEPGPGGQLSHYLHNVPLMENFVVEVDWGTVVPGDVFFRRTSAPGVDIPLTRIDPGDPERWKLDLDMGSGFSPPDGLIAVAVSGPIESDPFELPLRVIEKPQPVRSLGLPMEAETSASNRVTRSGLEIARSLKYVGPDFNAIAGTIMKAIEFANVASSVPLVQSDPPEWLPDMTVQPFVLGDGSGELYSLDFSSSRTFNVQRRRTTNQASSSRVSLAKGRQPTAFKLAKVDFGGSIGLAFVHRYVPDTWTYGGRISAGINFAADIPPQPILFAAGPVPLYVQGLAELGLAAALELSAFAEDGSGASYGAVTVSPSIGVGGLIGVGAGKFAGVDASVTARLPADFTIQDVDEGWMVTTLDLNLSIGLNLRVALFTIPSPRLDFTFDLISIFGQPTAPGGLYGPPPPDSGWSLMDRSYLGSLDLPSRFAADGVGTPRMLDAATSETVLVMNAFPVPTPCLQAIDTGVLLIWLNDDPSRTDSNRTELSFSVYDDSTQTWSAPVPVADDGTADFTPDCAPLPGGAVLAAWQDLNGVVTEPADPNDPSQVEATMEEFFQRSEITLATFDSTTQSWGAETTLTADSILDHSPALSVASDGTAIVAWITNADNNPFGEAAEPNSIRVATFDGATWSAPQTVATGLGRVEWLDVATNTSDAVIVYSMDTDDDEFTFDDREVFSISRTGATWAAPVQVTDDLVHDENPQIVWNDTQWRLTWYRGGSIFETTDVAGATDAAEIVPAPGNSQGVTDYRLINGDNGLRAVIAQRPSEDLVDLWASIYDPVLDSWGEPQRLTSDQDAERSYGAAFDADANLHVAFARSAVTFEPVNAVVLGDPIDVPDAPTFGDSDLVVLSRDVGTNLRVTPENVAFEPDNIAPSAVVEVFVRVENIGDLPARDIPVSLYEGDPDSGGELIEETIIEDLLPAGQSAEVSFLWAVPDPVGSEPLHVFVDRDNTLGDLDPSDNEAILADIRQPDVTVASALTQTLGPDDILVTARIQNVGGAELPAGVETEIRENDESGALLATLTTTRALIPGAFQDLTWLWESHPPFPDDSAVLFFNADPADTLAEGLEDNNTRFAQVFQRVPAPPVADCTGDHDKDGSVTISDLIFVVHRLGSPTRFGDEPGFTTADLRAVLDNLGVQCEEAAPTRPGAFR